MSEPQNTVTRLTPPGVGAIAVVRISGPSAEGTLANHFAKPVPAGRCVYGNLTDGNRIVDDIVVVRVSDLAFDLNIHGGDWLTRSVVDLFVHQGFTVVAESPEPAETLLRQEVLLHLPRAMTEPGVRLLLAQESLWKEIKSQADCGCDVSSVLREALSNRALPRLLDPPRVAIVGPANVGKSTLANQLFGRDRSITADVPGTTRDWVGELANIDGLPVMLIDTPGIRATTDPIEHAAIHASRTQIELSEMILLVIDGALPLDGEQRALLARFPDATVVINKSDRPFGNGIDAINGIRTVATTGVGVDSLGTAILQFFCNADSIPLQLPSIWTSRQRGIVERAIADISALREL